MNEQITKTSKFLSLILRHSPATIGITLDPQGWAEIDTLITLANKKGKRLNRELLQTVVDTNDKKRFTISEDGLRIRAAQGHSLKTVDIGYQAITPPDVLYHGTATRFLQSIRQQGLIPGSRQFVHLSQEQATAVNVGQRHGLPVVLIVDAAQMQQQGHEFYQAENGVWLTEKVPVKFIQF
jgi:putative RNA 2'-phosphotransferase